MGAENADLPTWALQILATMIGGGFGSLIGYKLAIRSHIVEKRHDFIIEQLRDFYTPMLALHAQIVAKTERCFDVRNDNYLDPDIFHADVWPLYRQLATHFSTNLWLASPDTRKLYDDVIKVVEGFEYDTSNGLLNPDSMAENVKWLDLDPFYAHLKAKLDELQQKLLPDELRWRNRIHWLKGTTLFRTKLLK
jgi:hypothetical protein